MNEPRKPGEPSFAKPSKDNAPLPVAPAEAPATSAKPTKE